MMIDTHTSDPYKLVQLPTELWDIGKVSGYEKNTKVHSREHIEKLKKSIAADGLFDALIVDMDGVIIAGHGRFEALVALGHVKVPVKHAASLTKNQAAAARISHNKTASLEYNSGFMSEELAMLSEDPNIDITALGLDMREYDFLTDDIGEMDPSALSVDLPQDIDDQDAETAEKVAAVDGSAVKFVKAVGFNEIPILVVSAVRRWIADIENETGLKGEEAFVNWVEARP